MQLPQCRGTHHYVAPRGTDESELVQDSVALPSERSQSGCSLVVGVGTDRVIAQDVFENPDQYVEHVAPNGWVFDLLPCCESVRAGGGVLLVRNERRRKCRISKAYEDERAVALRKATLVGGRGLYVTVFSALYKYAGQRLGPHVRVAVCRDKNGVARKRQTMGQLQELYETVVFLSADAIRRLDEWRTMVTAGAIEQSTVEFH